MTVIQPTVEVAPGITIPVGPPTTITVAPPPPGGVPTGRPAGPASAGRPATAWPTATVTGAQQQSATISPQPLAADLRSVDNRDCPSRTDSLGAALADVVGGPVGRHALIGRTRVMTPLRVMFLIALVFLALGWSTKAACLQSTGTGTGDQRVANWENQRAYYELCYSDTVPLYGAELLSQGKFPYKSSWVETDGSGTPQTRYDGRPAVRYMEYPVLTGVYQYVSMALAKTYTALSKLAPLPVVAEVVMFFDVAAFGLALAWLGDRLGDRRPGGPAHMGCGPGGRLAAGDLSDLHQLRCAGNGIRDGRTAGVGATQTGAGRCADRIGRRGQAVSAVVPWARCWCWASGPAVSALWPAPRGRPRSTWPLVNLPVLVLFPRGWSEFFRLNTRRGDDMDSLYNVVKSFTGWRGFDPKLGFWEPPTVLNTVVAVLFVVVLCGNRLRRAHRSAAARGWRSCCSWWWRRSC